MSKYEDIMDHPHHISKKRPQMSMHDRAAQFSPFAALTGYESAIEETARVTDRRVELDEYELQKLDEQLQEILEHITEHPEVNITYFMSDEKKEGGAYVTKKGCVKKLEKYEQRIVLLDGTKIEIPDIVEIAKK